MGWLVGGSLSLAVSEVCIHASIGISSSSSKWAACIRVATVADREEEENGGEKGRRRQKVVRNSLDKTEKIFEFFFFLQTNRTELFFRLTIPNR